MKKANLIISIEELRRTMYEYISFDESLLNIKVIKARRLIFNNPIY
ncbi:hypothetical protein [uncultured Clostridium sp.]|nr:hypothetical protein [uncultured Clostridium sp.]